MMRVVEVMSDLWAEQDALDKVLSDLADAQWDRPTPSPRWTVTDQVAHLTFFDHAAATAIRDPQAFAAARDELTAQAAQGPHCVDAHTLGPLRELSVAERLTAWRAGRADLRDAAAQLRDEDRVGWYGPSMGAKSFLTARLMECWAHGQDVVDAVGATRAPTDRLRHIAQLGVITRGWTYANRKLQLPVEEVRVVLASPTGGQWEWGPADAPCKVAGSAEDFCLVVTQRRRLHDTELTATGEAAIEWMTVAQAFAGPPTMGPNQ